jgi:selenocysteine lyase/cysteine desulfurase
MLPWRKHDLRMLPFTTSADEHLEVTRHALRYERVDLLAVTGASNVTGEVWPLEQLAGLAHEHGAQLFVDAAQLAPHRAIAMADAGIDHLALSGHKLYAPFGAGALVSRTPLTGSPLLQGGGAIKLVTVDDVIWADAPDRFEAGSPNVIGAVALAAACEALDMAAVEANERVLAERLHAGLATIDGLTPYALWPGHPDRVGVASFNLAGYKHCALAEVLSDNYAIGVRHGCFCAHPLLTRLLCVPDSEAERLHAELQAGLDPELPGAVRASIGLGTTAEDIDALIAALTARRGRSG